MRDYGLRLCTFIEPFCSDECAALYAGKYDYPTDRAKNGRQYVGVFLDRGEEILPSTPRGDLDVDREQIRVLYHFLLSYAADAVNGKAKDPFHPITEFAPATIVADFLKSAHFRKSNSGKSLAKKFEELDDEQKKMVLQRLMAATNITGMLHIHGQIGLAINRINQGSRLRSVTLMRSMFRHWRIDHLKNKLPGKRICCLDIYR